MSDLSWHTSANHTSSPQGGYHTPKYYSIPRVTTLLHWEVSSYNGHSCVLTLGLCPGHWLEAIRTRHNIKQRLRAFSQGLWTLWQLLHLRCWCVPISHSRNKQTFIHFVKHCVMWKCRSNYQNGSLLQSPQVALLLWTIITYIIPGCII